MAEAVNYHAWFSDRRERPYRVPMDIHIAFIQKQFHGLGKDKIGYFAVINGSIQGSEIWFEKKYRTHSVMYKGKLASTKTPLVAEGTWYLQSTPHVNGSWGMSLQGSPTHGAVKHVKKPLPKPRQNISSAESWVHSIVQWVPIPFVATTWDAGASLFYLCTGNTEAARERIGDAGVDLAWDALAIATGGEAEVAREVERGAAVAAREVEMSTVEAGARAVERRGSMEMHPAMDTIEEAAAEVEFRTEAVHGAPPPAGDGQVNQAGSYSEISRNHSLRNVTEANHIPPSSTTRATVYDVGHRNLPCLSTEYSLHQGLNRILGTTGRGQTAQEIRQAIRQYLLNRDLPSALKLQILADYGVWGGIEEHYSGLQRLIRHQEGLLRSDGQPFLNRQEAQGMLQWLQQQVTRFRNANRSGQANSYLGGIDEEILSYMSDV